LNTDTLNVVIGGEAGQGLVTIGELLARTLVRSGYHIVVTQDYMSRIRGGHNTFSIRMSTEPIAAPQEPIDCLVALNRETADLHQQQLTPEGMIIIDESAGLEESSCLKVPFKELAPRKFENVAALGVVGALLGLEESILTGVMEDSLGKKKPELAEENRRALMTAYTWAFGQPFSFPSLSPVGDSDHRLMMNGNEAIALGAVSAGVKFCSFYPMTPATSISLNIVKHSDPFGIVVEQAEDEIAAINMAIGASFAGAPSMVATSGGGFALMTEGVSLAAMTETPIVIVIAQRPGPATGLPTRTEQADLEFVLHAGHGEFPRAVLTPVSVEDCFTLTRKAFALADRYQGPVFLLTDQFLADSFRAVAPFNIEDIPSDKPGPGTIKPPYKRFSITDSGISPRLLPGMSEHLVVADSDEHTEDGHITEDLGIRRQMVEKRLRKQYEISKEVLPPEFEGDEKPKLLLMSWGSSKGAVREAADAKRSDGKRVSTLYFSQVWPLVPEQLIGYLESAEMVVCVEGNATGQFARLVRRETGFWIKNLILRYDGLPFTPEYILERLADE